MEGKTGLNRNTREIYTGLNRNTREGNTGMNRNNREVNTGLNRNNREGNTGVNRNTREGNTGLNRNTREGNTVLLPPPLRVVRPLKQTLFYACLFFLIPPIFFAYINIHTTAKYSTIFCSFSARSTILYFVGVLLYYQFEIVDPSHHHLLRSLTGSTLDYYPQNVLFCYSDFSLTVFLLFYLDPKDRARCIVYIM